MDVGVGGGEPKSLLSEIPRVNSSGFGLEFWTNPDTHYKYPETSWVAVVFSLILVGRSSCKGGETGFPSGPVFTNLGL